MIQHIDQPWAGRSHSELAALTRELLLAGHMIDRSGMPHLISEFGRDAMTEVAIGEWMAASPLYTERMQRLLGFEGDTVATIFKGIQLDIGAPHEFMDFRFSVQDDHHGEFRLDHCGALMDVEPMGEDYVVAMCHDIEDPTFDATAIATNPKARVRPVHRPPRVPADRSPHCQWTVIIDEGNDPLPRPDGAIRLATSRAMQLPLAAPHADLPTDDGWSDYAGDFDPDFHAERLSSSTLSAVLDELALQGHLLSRAYLLELAERADPERVRSVGIKQAVGIAGLAAKRLASLLDAPNDLVGIASVLAVHPLFLPRSYVSLNVSPAADRLDVAIGPCAALDEEDGLTWAGLLADDGGDAILESIVTCTNDRGQVERREPAGAAARWSISIDEHAEPARQPNEVTLTEFSTGATFAFATASPTVPGTPR